MANTSSQRYALGLRALNASSGPTFATKSAHHLPPGRRSPGPNRDSPAAPAPAISRRFDPRRGVISHPPSAQNCSTMSKDAATQPATDGRFERHSNFNSCATGCTRIQSRIHGFIVTDGSRAADRTSRSKTEEQAANYICILSDRFQRNPQPVGRVDYNVSSSSAVCRRSLAAQIASAMFARSFIIASD
jgi:hypothetical protein